MFKLGIITDEMSQNLDEALAFAKKMGLDCFELRSAWERDAFEYSDDDFSEIKRLSDKYEIPLVSISSPFYKCSFFDDETRERHINGLKRLIEKAAYLGVSQIRCFDFLHDSRVSMEMIAEAYRVPIDLCKNKGITILIESEPSANSFNNKRTAELVKYIDSPAVRALYEPGNNLYGCTEEIPYPDGYNFVKDVFSHIHIKDATIHDNKTIGVAIGSGDVRYKELFEELINSRYGGAVILEPHYKIGGVISEDLLHNPKGSAFSEGGFAVCEECVTAVRNIVREITKG